MKKIIFSTLLLISSVVYSQNAIKLGSYATQSWIGTQGYATQSWIGTQGYATQSWIGTHGYATQSWVTSQGFLYLNNYKYIIPYPSSVANGASFGYASVPSGNTSNVGPSFEIYAGDAKGTDKAGGDLVLRPGLGTGSSTAKTVIKRSSTTSTGTQPNHPYYDGLVVLGDKILTSGVKTLMFTVNMENGGVFMPFGATCYYNSGGCSPLYSSTVAGTRLVSYVYGNGCGGQLSSSGGASDLTTCGTDSFTFTVLWTFETNPNYAQLKVYCTATTDITAYAYTIRVWCNVNVLGTGYVYVQ